MVDQYDLGHELDLPELASQPRAVEALQGSVHCSLLAMVRQHLWDSVQWWRLLIFLIRFTVVVEPRLNVMRVWSGNACRTL